MRKLIFIQLVAFLMLQTVFGQISPVEEMKYSPNGYFETVFDHYGNSYQLKDLLAGADVKVGKSATSSIPIPCDTGIFELYFETGSGMEDQGDASHNARRAVVCRVFHDLSDFIVTPLKDLGNTTKVKIWVRNINNLPNVPSNALGLATSFYTMPYNTTANFGGIIDNEVWKTITLGSDSFINVASPLTNTNGNQSSSGNFYHGMMAFNFNSVIWNTNLGINAPTSQYDLYTVVLHEVTHALGFTSLINANGQSVFGTGYNYFSRYDSLLKNNGGTQKIITNNGTCSLYNYSFNSSLNTSILHPNTSSCVTDQTTCSTAIKFFGPTNTTPVYTSNCFEPGSSLSHFEDECIAPPNQGNNSYFAMSNAVGAAVTKRFLKPEERNALSDIGYRLNTSYGSSAVLNSSINYGGSITTGNTVAGTNDGIDSFGVYTFFGNTGTNINLTNLLTNDKNAISFECLEDVFDTTASIPTTSGSNSTPITFSSTIDGLHLLRYVPISANGQKGNISYIYVYINNDSCGTSTSCNLVINGNFEQHNGLPTGSSQLNGIVCGWHTTMASQSNEYFHEENSNINYKVPCNIVGFENDNSGGKAYVGMFIKNSGVVPLTEPLRTKLASSLLPNSSYQLSFDVSLGDFVRDSGVRFQAFFGDLIPPYSGFGYLPISNLDNMLFTNPTYSIFRNTWEKIVINFTTGNNSGEEYLYIGGLTSLSGPDFIIPQVPFIDCNTGNNGIKRNDPYYYLDNVSLISLNGGSFDIPNQVCTNVTINNLDSYLEALPIDGVFSGDGVSESNGIFSFDASIAGVGNHTITYTYTNSNGCEVEIYANIEVVSDGIIPEFDPIAPICSGGSITLPTTSVNFINGSWSPAVNNTATTTYTFTPNANQCGAVTTTLTVEVLPANDPSCSSNPCPPDLTLSTPETNNTIVYKTENWIKANSSYEVDGQNVTMKAGDSIVFEPNAHLKAGSVVTALIEVCTATSKMSTTKVVEKTILDEKTLNESIVLFPNPTTDRLTIASDMAAMNSIVITAMDGKIIYSNQTVNATKLELDTSNYQGGIYMVAITTINGTGFVKKLVKK
ncbi:T9SS type A sorting domain-containing protein [Flavobacterium sp. TP390]|uniref:T9SS type A sorting domain-containing protein n=1 Tax=Flavobacterium profundi TaxID=1774945 RepID=A0A6I4IVF0_9FLAO|nr:T9SS type A sorting domain-containing protein [Flavobacterium profundi]MVO10785.1 T9SS type A sorting domain-containing protein [Flavobacterium profundi]